MDDRTLLRGGVLVLVGTAVYALQKMGSPPLHDSVKARKGISERSLPIAQILSQLFELRREAETEELMDKVEEVLSLDKKKGSSIQWRISRLNGDIVKKANDICQSVSASSDEEVFRSRIIAQDESIPQLTGILDNLLHNHILSS